MKSAYDPPPLGHCAICAICAQCILLQRPHKIFKFVLCTTLPTVCAVGKLFSTRNLKRVKHINAMHCTFYIAHRRIAHCTLYIAHRKIAYCPLHTARNVQRVVHEPLYDLQLNPKLNIYLCFNYILLVLTEVYCQF